MFRRAILPVVASCLLSTLTATSAVHPNILFICLDDFGWKQRTCWASNKMLTQFHATCIVHRKTCLRMVLRPVNDCRKREDFTS